MVSPKLQAIKALRKQSGMSLKECRNAWDKSEGNFEVALGLLQTSSKKNTDSSKAAEGIIVSYIHQNKIGVLLEVNCQTDFASRTDQFKELCDELTMQIAATDPDCVSKQDISANTIETKSKIFKDVMLAQGKNDKLASNIARGKVAKWIKETCLLSQGWIRDPKTIINALVDEVSNQLGEAIVVKRFARYQLGK
jgi:elongation factor Ts